MSASTEPEGYRIPIHQSLVRPALLAGAERPLVLLMAGICAMPAATGDFRTIAFGIIAWIGSLFLLRRLAKRDPILSETIARLLNYPLHISAQPSIVAVKPPSPEHQKL